MEPCHSIVSAHPEVAGAVLRNPSYRITGESLTPGVRRECVGLVIELVQPVLCPDPHGARVIEVNRIYLVITQGSTPIHVVLIVGCELPLNGVETIYTPQRSSQPECALRILDHFREERI